MEEGKKLLEDIQIQINHGKATLKDKGFNENELSDGYHSFNELYEFRKVLQAVLFNEWAETETYVTGYKVLYDVHKSWKHNDGEDCFGGGWFIVVAMLPTGQITNHYKAADWDLFKIPAVDQAKYEYDGHNAQDVLQRLRNLLENVL
jgi:hypothetical protein